MDERYSGLNTSLYNGSVNYISIDDSEKDYWRIPLEAMVIQGNSVSIASSSGGSNPSCAIDTGTTLIGVPSQTANRIYSQIAGAEALSASSGYEGYYQYPCDTEVTVSLQFGGMSYSISNADMNLGSFTRDTSMCTGAFFAMDMYVFHSHLFLLVWNCHLTFIFFLPGLPDPPSNGSSVHPS